MHRQDCNDDNGVADFGYDITTMNESQSGHGEVDLIHLNGKRPRDIARDAIERADLKRANRSKKSTEEMSARKNLLAEKKKVVLESYASIEKLGALCSGLTKCCNGKCLEVCNQSKFCSENHIDDSC